MSELTRQPLARYHAARRALAEARSVDEVKDIHDKAEAMRAYAVKARDLEFVWWAAELKLDAERKGGRLLTEMAERGERDPGGKPVKEIYSDLRGKIEDVDVDIAKSGRLRENIGNSFFGPCLSG